MGKRKAAVTSSDDEDETYQRVAESESPERPLQTARRGGKKAKKVRPINVYCWTRAVVVRYMSLTLVLMLGKG